MLNFEDPGRMTTREFYNYEMELAHAFYEINKRGVHINERKLASLRLWLETEIKSTTDRCSVILGGREVFAQGKKLPKGSLNLSSGKQIISTLASLGINAPVKRQRGTQTVDEEALNALFSQHGHPLLKEILRIRELNKMLGTYVNAELENSTLYSSYFVTGTVTGRRSSRENFLGLGTNGQNQPKHSDLGKRYRECMEARPGKIFVACDQVQAEDWVVNALIADISGDRSGLDEQLAGIDRHSKLAAFIFSKPIDQCGKDTPERFMGKKTRHAGNYDVEGYQLSSAFAKEGFLVPPKTCFWLLERFHAASPGIKNVFHKYVQDSLINTRTLVTPFGRTRQFFGLRDYADNKKIFKEAYAYVPQSTVGDNTGITVLWIESNYPGLVIADGHDSITLEVDDNINSVLQGVDVLKRGFHRIVRFPNGLCIEIPIEFELGYNLASYDKKSGSNPEGMRTCRDLSETGLTSMYETLRKQVSHLRSTTSGLQLQQSAAR